MTFGWHPYFRQADVSQTVIRFDKCGWNSLMMTAGAPRNGTLIPTGNFALLVIYVGILQVRQSVKSASMGPQQSVHHVIIVLALNYAQVEHQQSQHIMTMSGKLCRLLGPSAPLVCVTSFAC